jgi:DNA-binding GntR family transcriptional regulator
VPVRAASRPLKPVQHESLVELAYRSIRDSIVSGRLPMGSRLVEARLAAELGVSRGPVREALRRLREEQLVLERPRVGCFVRSFDGDDLVDIYNLRLAIEAAAIRLATRNGVDTRRLRRLIDQMGAAAHAGRIERVVDAEFAFHEELFLASRNPHLIHVFKMLSAQLRMALSLDNSAYSELADVATEHRELVDAIDARDEHRAVCAMRSHIVSTVGETIRRLGGDPERLLDGTDGG